MTQKHKKPTNPQTKPPISTKQTSKKSKPQGTVFKQLNLQKKRTATATFLKELEPNSIGLIQEQHSTRGQVKDTPQSHKCFVGNPSSKNPHRSAVIIPVEMAKHSILLNGLSNNDLTVIKSKIGNKCEILIVSIYMDINKDIPIQELQDICTYANKNKMNLIMGIDSNSHNTTWGSKDNNTRGDKLMDLISSENLIIENEGNKPTFENKRCNSVIDITLTNQMMSRNVQSWKVINSSLSDHNMIRFEVGLKNKYTQTYKDYKNTDWNMYNSKLSQLLANDPLTCHPLTNQNQLDRFCDKLTNHIYKATEEATPTKTVSRKTSVPWWSHQLTAEKQKTKALKKRLKKSNFNPDINTQYKQQDKKYQNLIAESKEKSWQKKCSETETLSRTAKLTKILKGNKRHELNTLIKNDKHTDNMSETLEYLADTLLGDETHHTPNNNNTDNQRNHNTDEDVINKIIDNERLDSIMKDLQNNKSPGPDNIRNEPIKKGWETLKPKIRHLFKHSLLLGTTPKIWNNNKGIIIPKPDKDSYEQARSFRIICLTSNIQKLLEKAILKYLEIDLKIDKKLTKNQFGFRKGSSTEAAIHKLTRKIEDAICHGNLSLCIFLDIEGAFDNISHTSMKRAMYEHNFPPTIAEWIFHMISNRSVTLSEKNTSIIRNISKGCPQGGVLSPLLWNITLNMLLSDKELYQEDINAFADDMVIQQNGTDMSTMRQIAIKNLRKINNWCLKNGIKLSETKTKAIVFSTKNKAFKFQPIKLGDSIINLENDVKYLGITLDRYLNWNTHIRTQCNKANRLLAACKKAIGKNWGLSPDKIRWIYKQVILPNITYCCFAWAHKTSMNPADRNATFINHLQKLQRRTALLITGGMFNTPTATLEIMAGLRPIHLEIHSKAYKCAIRLKLNDKWIKNPPNKAITKSMSHGHYLEKHMNKFNLLQSNKPDFIAKTPMLTRNFHFENEAYDEEKIQTLPNTHILIFTDGSKQTTQLKQAGAGIYISSHNTTLYENSISLGMYATIFQCEMFAIKHSAEWIINNNITNNVINIFSDSQSSIDALRSQHTSSLLVLNTNEQLTNAAKRNLITIIKVKSHTGIIGNDRADSLAKQSTMNPMYGPEPHIGFTFNQISNEITDHLTKTHKKELSNNTISDKGKIPTANILEQCGYKLVTNNREDLKNLTNILTGHNKLNYYQTIMTNKQNKICDHCNTAMETSEHFLAKCPAFSLQRVQTFGTTSTTIDFITKKFTPQTIIKYIKSTKGNKE